MKTFKNWLEEPLWQAMASEHPGRPKVERPDPKTQFSHYQLPVNLLSFLRIGKWHPKWLYSLRIVGLPLSVSSPGLVTESSLSTAADHLITWVKGAGDARVNALFNMPFDPRAHEKFCAGGFSALHTLPSAVFDHSFENFASYKNALRAPYRYRLNKALAHLDGHLVRRVVEPENFSQGLYQLYEGVYQRSQYPLEKASLDFFRKFPGQIVTLSGPSDEVIGFYQYVVVDHCTYFVFCGLDYTALETHNTYVLLLYDLLRTALDAGCRRIDFGQTTELMKLKLGCTLENRLLYVYHPTPLVRLGLRVGTPLATYRLPKTLPKLHPFKEPL